MVFLLQLRSAMARLLIYWAYHCRRRLLAMVLFPVAAAVFQFPIYGWLLISLAALVFAIRKWERFFWGFARRSWRVHGTKASPVVIYYDAALADLTLPESVLQSAIEIVKELGARFGFPLRRRLTVYLFTTGVELSRVFDWPLGGGALVPADAIVLAADSLYNRTALQEWLRHECTHLFSGYWGKLDPPFKCEGLATWFQGTRDGQPIDFCALALIKGNKFVPLQLLWSRPDFYADRPYNYTLAGSFTGFLLRSFGWNSYRMFFQEASSISCFRAAFQTSFGIPFDAAMNQWIEQLLQEESHFMPALETAVQEARIEAALDSWQLFLCLEEFEALDQNHQASTRAMWAASRAYFILRRYDQAARLCLRILQANDDRFRACQGLLFFCLGQAYDLQGQRDRAIEAYQQALAHADWADRAWHASTHEESKRYLQKPLTEQEWWNRYRRIVRSATKGRR